MAVWSLWKILTLPATLAAALGFAALGHAPPSGIGKSLGAALAGLDENAFERLMVAGVRLSLAEVTNGRWRIHPLLAELLRMKGDADWLERMTAWFLERLRASTTDKENRWDEVHAEVEALAMWLGELPIEDAARVERAGSRYAIYVGPFPVWARFCERLLVTATDPKVRSDATTWIRRAWSPKWPRTCEAARS